ncbi:LBL_2463 family protein [Leptospira kirschneri]|uniref:LBL_2463 family protein n=1 Tax=Leptospira kirschneri TaxID=29507 RepID=UPI003565AB15
MSLTIQKTKPVNKFHVMRLIGLENQEELNLVKKFANDVFNNFGYTKSLYTAVEMDAWSTWFYVREGSEILAAMRIVEKKPNNLIPLELGIIKDSEPNQRYALIGENIADWNSVSFLLNKKAMFAAVCVFHAAAQFCLDKNFEIVYGFYHKKVSSIVKLYNSIGAIPSKKYEKEVYFPECYYNGELVYLTPIEINKDALQKIKTRLW